MFTAAENGFDATFDIGVNQHDIGFVPHNRTMEYADLLLEHVTEVALATHTFNGIEDLVISHGLVDNLLGEAADLTARVEDLQEDLHRAQIEIKLLEDVVEQHMEEPF